MLKEYGYIRVGAISNKIEISNVKANVLEIIKCIKEAKKRGIEIACFPELSLTGSTCYDLFFTDDLINEVLKGLKNLKEFSKQVNMVFIVGAPLKINGYLYNCAISINKGKIIGVTPKTYISRDSETLQSRYFNSGKDLKIDKFELIGDEVVVSNKILYKCDSYPIFSYTINIGEDLYKSDYLNQMEAKIVFHLASETNLVGRKEQTKSLLKAFAQNNVCSYVHSNASSSESSSNVTYDGYVAISEFDEKYKEDNSLTFESKLIYSDIDVMKLENIRSRKNSNAKCDIDFKETLFVLGINKNELVKEYDNLPFVLDTKDALEEILNIQTLSLARRIKQLNKPKMIIGISGGSDSTLAFLVCLRVKRLLKMKDEDIIAVTMPGFGTSKRTYNNSLKLIKAGKALFKEISIVEACKQHYKDIGHNIDDYDITYENAQARERTQILFDLANDLEGIVVGTGDLSEMVLGWATYNGDQMSNYGVNIGIPKTLVLSLIKKIKDESKGELKNVLTDILNTPISPELLPLDKEGNIVQDSQNSVGPYKLHDFFIYHFLGYGASVKKVYYLAYKTFENEYSKEQIKATLTIFIKRLFTQQFKRSALADGVKVFEVGINAKVDLILPSDLSYKSYLLEVEAL